MTKHLPPPVTDEETAIEKRRAPTKAEVIEVLLRQEGRCNHCKDKLKFGQIDWDHDKALAKGGKNSAENFQALCPPCHKVKTKNDIQAIAKTKRHQKKRQVERGERTARTKQKMQSRGFDQRLRKKMDGTVEHRGAVE